MVLAQYGSEAQLAHRETPQLVRDVFNTQLERVLILLEDLEDLDKQVEVFVFIGWPLSNFLKKLVVRLVDHRVLIQIVYRPKS